MSKAAMDKLNGCIFITEDDDFLEKYKTIWDKVRADKKNLITSLSTIKNI